MSTNVPALLPSAMPALASIAGAVVSLLAGVKQSKKTREIELLKIQLAREASREQREIEAREELQRIRLPFLEVAEDVRQRINLIRVHNFLQYVRADETELLARRSHISVVSTVFRLAQYWGTIEYLYGNTKLRLVIDDNTRHVIETLMGISQTFASDTIDGVRFMVWREEQRAIGELMIGDSREKGNLKMLSFASFVEQYDSTFARWLANFEADLRSPRAETSPRLESLEHQFEQLVKAIATPMNIN